jgi:hypothetical protein
MTSYVWVVTLSVVGCNDSCSITKYCVAIPYGFVSLSYTVDSCYFRMIYERAHCYSWDVKNNICNHTSRTTVATGPDLPISHFCFSTKKSIQHLLCALWDRDFLVTLLLYCLNDDSRVDNNNINQVNYCRWWRGSTTTTTKNTKK